MIQVFSVNGSFFAAMYSPYVGHWIAITDNLFGTLDQLKVELSKPGWSSREVKSEVVPWEGELPFQNPIE